MTLALIRQTLFNVPVLSFTEAFVFLTVSHALAAGLLLALAGLWILLFSFSAGYGRADDTASGLSRQDLEVFPAPLGCVTDHAHVALRRNVTIIERSRGGEVLSIDRVAHLLGCQ